MLAALALLLGAVGGLAAADAPSALWVGFSLVLASAALVRGAVCDRRGESLRMASQKCPLLLATFLCGFAIVVGLGRTWHAQRVPHAESGERWLVRGEIVGIPERAGDEWRLTADVSIVLPRDRTTDPPRRMILTSRGRSAEFAAREQWQWLVQIAPAPAARGNQDPLRWWFRDGVHGTARIVGSRLNRRLQVAPPSIDGLRERVAVGVGRHVVDRDAAALVLALAVGLTDSMSTEQWRVFNATGTTHLVAISGMHVTMFAWIAFRCARLIWGLLPGLWRRVDREPFALALGVAAAAAYALLAGFSVPTQRTLAMLAIFAASRLSQRAVSSWRIFALALIAVLAIDPLAPLGAGFWLSFVAVATILLVAGGSLAQLGTLATAMRVQIGVLLALTPVTLAIFGGVSLAALVVNTVAIPVFTFVLVPLALLGSALLAAAPSIAGIAFGCAEWVYHATWPALAAAADWPLALWRANPAPGWYFLGAAAGLLALLPGPPRIRLTGIAVLFPLLFPQEARLPFGVASIELHDTGRGVVALIATRDARVIYDTGDYYDTRGRFLERLVPEWLQRAHAAAIDTIVLPRVSEDRAAGVGRLMALVRVREVIGGSEWRGATLPFTRCGHRRQWRSSGVTFETWVGADEAYEYCALRIGEGATAVLLASDFNRDAERDAVGRGVSPSQWVLVGRRGSPTASSDAWIEAMAARVAIVPAPWATGPNTARTRTLARWRQSGAELVLLDSTPAISLRLGPGLATNPALVSGTPYPFLWRRVR
jgi:competence protein ComEC